MPGEELEESRPSSYEKVKVQEFQEFPFEQKNL